MPASVPRGTPPLAGVLFGDRLPLALSYADALATTAAERGLIGPREVPRIWDRHLLNCVVLSEFIPPSSELADVGSGAGLPGLPLAIARPDVRVSLVEPLLRRVVWLREVVADLGLDNVEIIRARADAVKVSGQSFDVVTARAVAPLTALLELCIPLVRQGGELLAMKGDSAAQELADAVPLLTTLNAVEWSVDVCGVDVLSTPTTVVRVLAGQRAAGQWSGSKKRSTSSGAPGGPRSIRPRGRKHGKRG